MNNIADGLNNFQTVPSRAAGALGMEFMDQVLRAKGVQSDWRSFYMAHRLLLWPVVFSQSERWTTLQQEWRQQARQAWEVQQQSPG